MLEHPVGVVEMAQVLHADLCAGARPLRLPRGATISGGSAIPASPRVSSR
ncbi:hypothetical protein [Brachybacterium sp. GPGPB12]